MTEPKAEPRPVNQAWDREARKLHQGRWVMVWGLIVIALASVGILAYLVIQANHRLDGNCAFYRDIATAQVQPNPTTHKPTKLGVQIIIDSRIAYLAEGCSMRLIPPPSPALMRWAGYYHINV